MSDRPPEAPKTHETPQIVMQALPGGFLQLEIKGVVPAEIGAKLLGVLSEYRDSRPTAPSATKSVS
ncbi:hypothetical protein [Variibacter gotjawalensis]|uniref:hypothetical protein n=1 Tax=Variibacter gotjawalensis TaxID=1333996 RepID=UPI00102CA60E|nr:hypothetical protein [Variibacter gotjawalensis]NIK46318.1 hypothetical protein [Variibacter gotjawalensis]